MTTTNERKAAQLTMPYGTACAKLRQQLFFKLLVETGRNVCHVCGETILTVDECSIEHIKPWLNVDPSLFWDHENIAFSHRKCNRPNRPSGGGNGSRPKFMCGTQGGYRNGCRCKRCKTWKHNDNKRWAKNSSSKTSERSQKCQ